MLKVIDEELDKLRKGGVKDEELARAKTTILADNVFDLERSSARGNRLNTYNHYVGDPNWLGHDIARYSGATATSVSEIARTYLKEHDRVVALVTTKKEAPIAGRIVKAGPAGGGGK